MSELQSKLFYFKNSVEYWDLIGQFSKPLRCPNRAMAEELLDSVDTLVKLYQELTYVNLKHIQNLVIRALTWLGHLIYMRKMIYTKNAGLVREISLLP
jgi:hypothetical protein